VWTLPGDWIWSRARRLGHGHRATLAGMGIGARHRISRRTPREERWGSNPALYAALRRIPLPAAAPPPRARASVTQCAHRRARGGVPYLCTHAPPRARPGSTRLVAPSRIRRRARWRHRQPRARRVRRDRPRHGHRPTDSRRADGASARWETAATASCDQRLSV